jgi:pyruvate/2-oxoglutarate dehydrogenase complex dihydrolipoamide dehydrogenase (E3) component
VHTPSGDQTIEGSDILAGAGRTPNTEGIGLELAGVALDTRGYVAVNDRLETSAPDVWAVGECAGSSQFTHVSADDFRIVREKLVAAIALPAAAWSPIVCSPTRRWRGSG